jgi:hypothetical protein
VPSTDRLWLEYRSPHNDDAVQRSALLATVSIVHLSLFTLAAWRKWFPHGAYEVALFWVRTANDWVRHADL